MSLNSSGLSKFHLRRIGPRSSCTHVANFMDFHEVHYFIGRSLAESDYVIDSDEHVQKVSVSRFHARIVRQAGNQHRLFDDSRNGVFINNVKISESHVLQEGDKVTFGHPSGEKIKSGTWERQPRSHHQFLFERCTCRGNGEVLKAENKAAGMEIENQSKDTGQSDVKELVSQVVKTEDMPHVPDAHCSVQSSKASPVSKDTVDDKGTIKKIKSRFIPFSKESFTKTANNILKDLKDLKKMLSISSKVSSVEHSVSSTLQTTESVPDKEEASLLNKDVGASDIQALRNAHGPEICDDNIGQVLCVSKLNDDDTNNKTPICESELILHDTNEGLTDKGESCHLHLEKDSMGSDAVNNNSKTDIKEMEVKRSDSFEFDLEEVGNNTDNTYSTENVTMEVEDTFENIENSQDLDMFNTAKTDGVGMSSSAILDDKYVEHLPKQTLNNQGLVTCIDAVNTGLQGTATHIAEFVNEQTDEFTDTSLKEVISSVTESEAEQTQESLNEDGGTDIVMVEVESPRTDECIDTSLKEVKSSVTESEPEQTQESLDVDKVLDVGDCAEKNTTGTVNLSQNEILVCYHKNGGKQSLEDDGNINDVSMTAECDSHTRNLETNQGRKRKFSDSLEDTPVFKAKKVLVNKDADRQIVDGIISKDKHVSEENQDESRPFAEAFKSIVSNFFKHNKKKKSFKTRVKFSESSKVTQNSVYLEDKDGSYRKFVLPVPESIGITGSSDHKDVEAIYDRRTQLKNSQISHNSGLLTENEDIKGVPEMPNCELECDSDNKDSSVDFAGSVKQSADEKINQCGTHIKDECKYVTNEQIKVERHPSEEYMDYSDSEDDSDIIHTTFQSVFGVSRGKKESETQVIVIEEELADESSSQEIEQARDEHSTDKCHLTETAIDTKCIKIKREGKCKTFKYNKEHDINQIADNENEETEKSESVLTDIEEKLAENSEQTRVNNTGSVIVNENETGEESYIEKHQVVHDAKVIGVFYSEPTQVPHNDLTGVPHSGTSEGCSNGQTSDYDNEHAYHPENVASEEWNSENTQVHDNKQIVAQGCEQTQVQDIGKAQVQDTELPQVQDIEQTQVQETAETQVQKFVLTHVNDGDNGQSPVYGNEQSQRHDNEQSHAYQKEQTGVYDSEQTHDQKIEHIKMHENEQTQVHDNALDHTNLEQNPDQENDKMWDVSQKGADGDRKQETLRHIVSNFFKHLKNKTQVHNNELIQVYDNEQTHLHNNEQTHMHDNEQSHLHDNEHLQVNDTEQTQGHEDEHIQMQINEHTKVHDNEQIQVCDNEHIQVCDNGQTQTCDNVQTKVCDNEQIQVCGNEQTEVCGNEQTQVCDNEQTQVHNNEQTKVHDNEQIQVHDNEQTQVHNNEQTQVHNNEQTQVHDNEQIQVHDNEQTQVHDNEQTQVCDNEQKQVHDNEQAKVCDDEQTEVCENVQIQVCDNEQTQVCNNEHIQVHDNEQKQVHDNELTQVHNNEQTQVGDNEQKQVHDNEQTQVHDNEQIQVHDNEQTQVHDNKQIQVHDNKQTQVHDNEQTKVCDNEQKQVHDNEKTKVCDNEQTEVCDNVQIQVHDTEQTKVHDNEQIQVHDNGEAHMLVNEQKQVLDTEQVQVHHDNSRYQITTDHDTEMMKNKMTEKSESVSTDVDDKLVDDSEQTRVNNTGSINVDENETGEESYIEKHQVVHDARVIGVFYSEPTQVPHNDLTGVPHSGTSEGCSNGQTPDYDNEHAHDPENEASEECDSENTQIQDNEQTDIHDNKQTQVQDIGKTQVQDTELPQVQGIEQTKVQDIEQTQVQESEQTQVQESELTKVQENAETQVQKFVLTHVNDGDNGQSPVYDNEQSQRHDNEQSHAYQKEQTVVYDGEQTHVQEIEHIKMHDNEQLHVYHNELTEVVHDSEHTLVQEIEQIHMQDSVSKQSQGQCNKQSHVTYYEQSHVHSNEQTQVHYNELDHTTFEPNLDHKNVKVLDVSQTGTDDNRKQEALRDIVSNFFKRIKNKTCVHDNEQIQVHDNEQIQVHDNEQTQVHDTEETQVVNNDTNQVCDNEQTHMHDNEQTQVCDNEQTHMHDNEQTQVHDNEQTQVCGNEQTHMHDNEQTQVHDNEQTQVCDNEQTHMHDNEQTQVHDWDQAEDTFIQKKSVCVIHTLHLYKEPPPAHEINEIEEKDCLDQTGFNIDTKQAVSSRSKIDEHCEKQCDQELDKLNSGSAKADTMFVWECSKTETTLGSAEVDKKLTGPTFEKGITDIKHVGNKSELTDDATVEGPQMSAEDILNNDGGPASKDIQNVSGSSDQWAQDDSENDIDEADTGEVIGNTDNNSEDDNYSKASCSTPREDSNIPCGQMFPALRYVGSDDETKSPVFPEPPVLDKVPLTNTRAFDELSCNFSDDSDTTFPDLNIPMSDSETENETSIFTDETVNYSKLHTVENIEPSTSSENMECETSVADDQNNNVTVEEIDSIDDFDEDNDDFMMLEIPYDIESTDNINDTNDTDNNPVFNNISSLDDYMESNISGKRKLDEASDHFLSKRQKVSYVNIKQESPTVEDYYEDRSPTGDDYVDHSPTVDDYEDGSSTEDDYADCSPKRDDYADRSPTVDDYADRSPTVDDYADCSPTVDDYADHSPTVDDYEDRSPTVDDYADCSPTVGDNSEDGLPTEGDDCEDCNTISVFKKLTRQSTHKPTGTPVRFSGYHISCTQLIQNPGDSIEDLIPASQMASLTEQLESKLSNEGLGTAKQNRARELIEKLKARQTVKRELETQEEEPGPSASLLEVPSNLENGHCNLEQAEAIVAKDIDSQTNRCKEVISQLKTVFESNSSLPRVLAWKDQLREIEEKLNFPQTVIAVVGKTGDGKSSLLNALLDERSVLPTSCMQACTAVVVEVTQNTTSDKYVAEIEFLEVQEWLDEVKVILKDLTGPNGRVTYQAPDSSSENYASYCKIKAVYGKIGKDPMKQNTVTRWLGRKKVIEVSKPEVLRSKVETYIEATDSSDGYQYWPIVKRVRLRIPHCDVCSSGAVLVDLPGVRDSNAARDNIAKEYMKNCTFIWVVSSIHRAIDDKTAKELLGENFRRQLLMDGQYGSVTFICTKTDIIEPSEVIRKLKIKERLKEHQVSLKKAESEKKLLELRRLRCTKESDTVRKGVAVLRKDVQDLEDNLDELEGLLDNSEHQMEDSGELDAIKESQNELTQKRDDVIQREQNLACFEMEIQDTSKQIHELESKIANYQKTIAGICAQARNKFSVKHIQNDYRAGLKDLKRRAGLLVEDNEESEDIDDDGAGSNTEKLQVFCCSATEYQKLQNLMDGSPRVFNCTDDTQIPTLRRYVHRITSDRNKLHLGRLVRRLERFVFNLKACVKTSEDEDSERWQITQSLIESEVEKLYKQLEPVVQYLSMDMDSVFSDKIKPKMDKGVAKAVKEAPGICAQWSIRNSAAEGSNRHSSGLPWATYKAVVCRQGTYSSRAFGYINFNEDLSEPVYNKLIIVWDETFSGLLWDILEKAKECLNTKLKEFVEHLGKTLYKRGMKKDQLLRVGKQFLGSACNKLEDMVIQLMEFISTKQREISRLITPHVQGSLIEPYNRASAQKGTGAFKMMKEHMSKGIDKGRLTMFDEATQKLMTELLNMQKHVTEYTNAVCKSLIQDLRATLEPLWSFAGQANPYSDTILPVLTKVCLEMKEVLARAGLETIDNQSGSSRGSDPGPDGSTSTSVNVQTNVQGPNIQSSVPHDLSSTHTTGTYTIYQRTTSLHQSIACTTTCTTSQIPSSLGASSTIGCTTSQIPSSLGASSTIGCTTSQIPSSLGASSTIGCTTSQIPSSLGASSTIGCTTSQIPSSLGATSTIGCTTSQRPTSLGATQTTSQRPMSLFATQTTSQRPTSFGSTQTTSQRPISLGATQTTSQRPTSLGATPTTSQRPMSLGATQTTSQRPISLGATGSIHNAGKVQVEAHDGLSNETNILLPNKPFSDTKEGLRRLVLGYHTYRDHSAELPLVQVKQEPVDQKDGTGQRRRRNRYLGTIDLTESD